jgi:hypothetical protein
MGEFRDFPRGFPDPDSFHGLDPDNEGESMGIGPV